MQESRNMKSYNVKLIEKGVYNLTNTKNSIPWNKAEVLTDFISPWDKEIPKKIEFKALWDTKNIFFCFTVLDNDIHINTKDDSVDSIANSDRVELFFRSDASLNPYYCLEIDPIPRVMDFMAYPNREFNFDWNWPQEAIKVKSEILDSKFSVEIAISIESLQKFNLIKNNQIETGIFRAKYTKNEQSDFEPIWITWVNPNTKEPDFHIPTSFGVLNLLKE